MTKPENKRLTEKEQAFVDAYLIAPSAPEPRQHNCPHWAWLKWLGPLTRFYGTHRPPVDAIRARIPGLSQDVLPRRDIWGEEIVRQGGLGPDLLSPVFESRLREDFVTSELVRLGASPARMRKEIRGVELTPEQFDEFQMIGGRLARQAVSSVVNQEYWSGLPDETQREMIARVLGQAREQARRYMLAKHPGLIGQAVDKKLERLGVGAVKQRDDARK